MLHFMMYNIVESYIIGTVIYALNCLAGLETDIKDTDRQIDRYRQTDG